jgi:DNA (cytosine-5)-methyltransferase 1
LLENVAALLNRGMGTVLGDLAEIGYDTEWNCIPSSSVGGYSVRDRVWIVANPMRDGLQGWQEGTPHARITEQLQGLLQTRVRPDISKLISDGKDYGVSGGMDKDALIGLGNSIDPGCAKVVMQAIKDIANPSPQRKKGDRHEKAVARDRY